jgi:hypothetical protein
VNPLPVALDPAATSAPIPGAAPGLQLGRPWRGPSRATVYTASSDARRLPWPAGLPPRQARRDFRKIEMAAFDLAPVSRALCLVCRSRPVTHILSPCGHRVLCGDCVGKVSRCPICDTRIVQTVVAAVAEKCRVCTSKPADTVLLPCGHLEFCYADAIELSGTTGKCPSCGTQIDAVRFRFPVFDGDLVDAGLIFQKVGDGAIVVGASNPLPECRIPISGTVGGSEFPVRIIGEKAFKASIIERLILPATVERLAKECFSDCSKLTSVVIEGESKLAVIEADAFKSSAVKLFAVPNSLEIVGQSAFARGVGPLRFCPGIDSRLAQIHEAAFAKSKLAEVSIPPTVRVIGPRCFESCTALTTVTFLGTSSLAEIGERVFAETSIASIQIPRSVTRLLRECFCSCWKLETIIIESDSQLAVIEASAFKGSIAKRFAVPNSLKTIGESAFEGTGLETLEIPATVSEDPLLDGAQLESIGNRAFAESGIRNFPALASLEHLGTGAFQKCHYIEKIDFSACVRLERFEASLFAGANKLKEIVIPRTVHTISASCFDGCPKLKTVIFADGSGLSEIGPLAFANCPLLAGRFPFPPSVQILGTKCFSGCKLAPIEFGEGSKLRVIEARAFFQCEKLTAFNIGACVQSIHPTFHRQSGLAGLTVSPDNPCFSIGGQLLLDKAGTTVVTVAVAAPAKIIIPPQITAIGEAAFQDLPSASIELHGGIAQIAALAFQNCHKLIKFTVPESLTVIPAECFAACRSLKTLTFPATSRLERIESRAFENCGALPTVIFPASLTVICSSAFSGCHKLAGVTFQANSQLAEIQESAFLACRALTQIILSAPPPRTTGAFVFPAQCALPVLAKSVFAACLDLATVEIPASVERISDSAFANCTKLATVRFAEGAKLSEIGKSAFEGCAIVRIEIPATVTLIDDFCFRSCPKLEAVTMKEGSLLAHVGQDAFAQCPLPPDKIPGK